MGARHLQSIYVVFGPDPRNWGQHPRLRRYSVLPQRNHVFRYHDSKFGPQAVGPQSVVNQLPNQHGWSCDLLGHQWHVAEWCVLQQPYRSTLWNADRIVAANLLHGPANNSGGSSMAYLNITVVDYLPTDFTYNPDDLQLTNNTAKADLPLTHN